MYLPRLLYSLSHNLLKPLFGPTASHLQCLFVMPPLKTPWPEQTGVFATYPLQCHCGAIQWTMRLSPPLLESQAEGKGVYTTLECDCTHCERKGSISCHPKMADVKFTQGSVRAPICLEIGRSPRDNIADIDGF